MCEWCIVLLSSSVDSQYPLSGNTVKKSCNIAFSAFCGAHILM